MRLIRREGNRVPCCCFLIINFACDCKKCNRNNYSLTLLQSWNDLPAYYFPLSSTVHYIPKLVCTPTVTYSLVTWTAWNRRSKALLEELRQNISYRRHAIAWSSLQRLLVFSAGPFRFSKGRLGSRRLVALFDKSLLRHMCSNTFHLNISIGRSKVRGMPYQIKATVTTLCNCV